MDFKQAWGQWLNKDFAAARNGFVAVARTSDDPDTRKRAWCGAAFMMVKLEQHAELEDWLFFGHQIRAGSVWAYEAALALYQENDSYLTASLRAAQKYDAHTMNPWVRGLSSLPIPYWVEQPRRMARFPEPKVELGGAAMVLLTSSDPNYFLRFSHILSEQQGAWHIRFHVVINSEESDASDLRDKVLAHTKKLLGNFSVSIEMKKGADKAYFASRRYMLAPSALDHYNLPVLVCDIDLAIKGDLAALPFDKPMLRYTDQLTIPWQKMTANACLLTPTADGRKLAKLMAQYLEQQFDLANGDIWWVDQNAMLFATKAADIAFNRWGPRFPQHFHAPTLHGDRDKDLAKSGAKAPGL